MIDTSLPLISEFLKDHQQFSRLLLQISNLLEQGKIGEARTRAIELDILAGPHIAYEELELYPRLARLGEKSVTEELLVGQHHDALNSVRRLVSETQHSESDLEELKEGFRGAIAHAEHCGTLISLMSRLDAAEQARSLAELVRLRKSGKKWTEL